MGSLISTCVFVLCQLIAMTDIKEMTPEFQKLNKTDNCIVIYLKNDARIAVTSQVTAHLGQVESSASRCRSS